VFVGLTPISGNTLEAFSNTKQVLFYILKLFEAISGCRVGGKKYFFCQYGKSLVIFKYVVTNPH